MLARRLHQPTSPQLQQPQSATVDEHRSRARRWLETSIAAWEQDERITPGEAATLRGKLDEPTVLAVLPHLGVHLAMSAVLRFPIGSVTRAGYTLIQFLLATLRLLVRNIDRRAWRQAMRIHSPLVILLAGLPGIGTFAYLAAKPLRTNHLLLRVGLDAVLLKLPFHVYQRTGLRWMVVRPTAAEEAAARAQPQLRASIGAADIALVMGIVAVSLIAVDVLVKVLDALGLIDTTQLGWGQIARLVDLDKESSFGTWYTGISLVFLSVMLAGIAYSKRSVGDRFARYWLVLAVLMLAFSIDEVAQLHDAGGPGWNTLRDRWGVGGPLWHTWIVFGAACVIVVAWFYLPFIAALPRTTRWLYILAAGLYVAGEVGMEMITGWYFDVTRAHDFTYQFLSTLEESLSIAGLFVAVAATLHYIQTSFGGITISLSNGVTTTGPVAAGSHTTAPPETTAPATGITGGSATATPAQPPLA